MNYFKLAVCAVLGLSLVGCTAAKQNAQTDSASVEWRIKSLEESFLNFREKQRQMADEAEQDRERMDQRLAAIEAEIASLRNGVPAPTDETPEPPMGEGWVTDLNPEDDEWVEGQKPAAPKVAQSNEDKPWSNVPKPPATIPEPEVIKRPTAKPKPVAKPRPKSVRKASGSKALYDKGYSQYSADNFDGARATFDAFLKKYPKDKLAPNALYWKGETYYSQKDYAQAIMTFKEVTGSYPKHHKSAAALLKIGMSYDRVGDPDNAIFYLRALVEDFPKSSEASMARKELKRLGG